METPLYTALALAGTWFRLFSARPLPGLLAVCFLAPLARPEGALLSGVADPAGSAPGRLEAHGRPIRARRPWGMALFFAFYAHAYGHWLPHSVVAKRLELKVGCGEALHSWILNVFYKGPSLGGRALVTVGNLAVLAGAAAGLARLRKHPAGAERAGLCMTILLWPGLYFLFSWPRAPAMPCSPGITCPCCLSSCWWWRWVGSGWRAAAPPAAGWALLFAFLAYVPFQTWRQDIPRKHRFAQEAREGRYQEAARILDSAGSASAMPPAVMIDEVGALGYFARVKIVDSHGLLSPEALPFLAGPGAHWSRLTAMRESLRPDWITGMRPEKDQGRFQPGEEALYAGYGLERVLRRPPHGFLVELWRREGD